MEQYMVKSMDNGKVTRKYFKTERGAMRFFNSCGSAALYRYDESTFCFEFVDAR